MEIRYARAQKRNRGEQEGKTLEEFKKLEKKEFASQGAEQQLGKTMAMANYLIKNKGTLKEFEQKLKITLTRIQHEISSARKNKSKPHRH